MLTGRLHLSRRWKSVHERKKEKRKDTEVLVLLGWLVGFGILADRFPLSSGF